MSCKWFESCPMRRWEDRGKISLKWKEEYCLSEKNWKNCRRFQMEETGLSHGDILPDGSKLEK